MGHSHSDLRPLCPRVFTPHRYNEELLSQGNHPTLSFEQKTYELRKEKLQQIVALGQKAYPYKYETTHTVPEILANFSERTGEALEAERVNVSVAGRLMAIRLMGKASFAHLQQRGQRLQIYVKKDVVGEK